MFYYTDIPPKTYTPQSYGVPSNIEMGKADCSFTNYLVSLCLQKEGKCQAARLMNLADDHSMYGYKYPLEPNNSISAVMSGHNTASNKPISRQYNK